MAQFFEIHPDNPQKRLIQQAVRIIDQGGLIVYPTDSSYALGCHIGDKSAMERIQRLRRLDNKHHFTLVCSDLSEIGVYAKVDNSSYRLMKTLTPGSYTFLLKATSEVPRRLMKVSQNLNRMSSRNVFAKQMINHKHFDPFPDLLLSLRCEACR